MASGTSVGLREFGFVMVSVTLPIKFAVPEANRPRVSRQAGSATALLVDQPAPDRREGLVGHREPPLRGDGPWRILVVEDSPEYAALVEQMLLEGLGPGLVAMYADSVSAAVVVLTGREDQAVALLAVQEGAQDFLPKKGIDAALLARAVRYAVERKRSELRAEHLSLHDALTGLPNRVLFLDRLNGAVELLRRQATSVAVLFIDLDRFKVVNDSLGHDVGDVLLAEVSDRLRRVLRSGDTVARVSVVADGKAAMEFVRRSGTYRDAARPDLILLDFNLPKKDGREVLAEIKSDPELARIPVVVLTTSAADEDILSAYDHHVNSYIRKPLRLDDFVQMMRSIDDYWLGFVCLPPR
jgi:chemotaxis family two-component system response regulator Rcp1